jgi:hypothetical protein
LSGAIHLAVELEIPESPTVLRVRKADYARKRAEDYADKPASLTERQALFYRNLMQIAQHLKSNELPVEIDTRQGSFFLDRGCVKIAVHAGFLQALENDENGTVSKIKLAWDATGTRE